MKEFLGQVAIPVLIGAILVGGVIMLLRWSFAYEKQKALQAVRETPLYSASAPTDSVYKFYGKLKAGKPAELPGKGERVIYGFLSISAEYGGPDGLVLQDVYCNVSVAENVYLELADGTTIPLQIGEPHSFYPCSDDVINESKFKLTQEEWLKSAESPDITVTKIEDDPNTPGQDFMVKYGDLSFTFYHEQLKWINKGVELRKKVLPAGAEVVVVGRLTEAGIAGTPEEPTLIFLGNEAQVKDKLGQES